MARNKLKDYQNALADFDAALKIDNQGINGVVAYLGRASSHLRLRNSKAGSADIKRATYILRQMKKQRSRKS